MERTNKHVIRWRFTTQGRKPQPACVGIIRHLKQPERSFALAISPCKGLVIKTRSIKQLIQLSLVATAAVNWTVCTGASRVSLSCCHVQDCQAEVTHMDLKIVSVMAAPTCRPIGCQESRELIKVQTHLAAADQRPSSPDISSSVDQFMKEAWLLATAFFKMCNFANSAN